MSSVLKAEDFGFKEIQGVLHNVFIGERVPSDPQAYVEHMAIIQPQMNAFLEKHIRFMCPHQPMAWLEDYREIIAKQYLQNSAKVQLIKNQGLLPAQIVEESGTVLRFEIPKDLSARNKFDIATTTNEFLKRNLESCLVPNDTAYNEAFRQQVFECLTLQEQTVREMLRDRLYNPNDLYLKAALEMVMAEGHFLDKKEQTAALKKANYKAAFIREFPNSYDSQRLEKTLRNTKECYQNIKPREKTLANSN